MPLYFRPGAQDQTATVIDELGKASAKVIYIHKPLYVRSMVTYIVMLSLNFRTFCISGSEASCANNQRSKASGQQTLPLPAEGWREERVTCMLSPFISIFSVSMSWVSVTPASASLCVCVSVKQRPWSSSGIPEGWI